MPKQKRARWRPKKNWMEGIKKALNERNLNDGQWEDRKQWSLGVGQHRKTFWNRYIHTYIVLNLINKLPEVAADMPKHVGVVTGHNFLMFVTCAFTWFYKWRHHCKTD
jgi:hypothetical protein